jgi:hypothetical protein
MKKLFMLFAFIGLVSATSVSAQTCCSKSKTASASCSAAAATAASLETDIEKRMVEATGEVFYVRKVVNSDSGTTYVNVEYNSDTKKFVNVSPSHDSDTAAKPASCSKGSAASGKSASCCSKDKGACTKKSASTTAVKKTSTAKVVKTSGTN